MIRAALIVSFALTVLSQLATVATAQEPQSGYECQESWVDECGAYDDDSGTVTWFEACDYCATSEPSDDDVCVEIFTGQSGDTLCAVVFPLLNSDGTLVAR